MLRKQRSLNVVTVMTLLSCSLLLFCSRSGQRFEIRLIETDDIQTEGVFAPRLTRCDSCERRDVELPGGDSISLRVEVDPRARFSVTEVREFRAAEVRDPVQPEVVHWLVLAALEQEAWERIQELVVDYPFDAALITLGSRPVAVTKVAAWTGGVEVGRFREEDAARAFVAQFDVPTTWHVVDEEAFAEVQRALEDLVRAERSTAETAQGGQK